MLHKDDASWQVCVLYWREASRLASGRGEANLTNRTWADVAKDYETAILARIERGLAEYPLPDDVVQLLMEVAANE